MFSQYTAVEIFKWSKTLQDRCKVVSVSVPNLGASSLCPIAALKGMCDFTAINSDQPLF